MSTTSFKTRSGTSYSTQISVDKDVTGATLTVEFARTSKFGSVILSKSATATGRVVTISLTSSEVDTLKDSYFRVKSVLDGVTEYVHFGTVDYTYVAVATPPITVNDVVNSTALKAALVSAVDLNGNPLSGIQVRAVIDPVTKQISDFVVVDA